MESPRVALVPGSARTGSLNRLLALDLADRLRVAGVDAQVIDLGDHPLPIYHGDDELEYGLPEAARLLHDELATMDGVIFVSPEYNGGLPALLKNAIDWVSRVDRSVFRQWLIGLAATSPGARGARDVLIAMRHIVDHMRLETLPVDLSVPRGVDAFDDAGPARLVRADVADAADEFVAAYAEALDTWVLSKRNMVNA